MNQTVTVNGREYYVDVRYDECMGAPWEEHDGHGIVSEWTTRDKHPGELILCEDRRSKRYYDLSASIHKATKEGWGIIQDHLVKLAKKLGHIPSQKEIIAESVRQDFEYLRGWCNDEWNWCGVIVTDAEDSAYQDSIWGVESFDTDCQDDIANELAHGLWKQWSVDHRFEHAISCGV